MNQYLFLLNLLGVSDTSRRFLPLENILESYLLLVVESTKRKIYSKISKNFWRNRFTSQSIFTLFISSISHYLHYLQSVSRGFSPSRILKKISSERVLRCNNCATRRVKRHGAFRREVGMQIPLDAVIGGLSGKIKATIDGGFRRNFPVPEGRDSPATVLCSRTTNSRCSENAYDDTLVFEVLPPEDR